MSKDIADILKAAQTGMNAQKVTNELIEQWKISTLTNPKHKQQNITTNYQVAPVFNTHKALKFGESYNINSFIEKLVEHELTFVVLERILLVDNATYEKLLKITLI